jgi:thiol peroxidase
MAQVTFKGTPVETVGELPEVGQKAPDFVLTKRDLSDVGLGDFHGRKRVLNIVPSLDTRVCAASAKRFEQEVDKLNDTVVLTVSNDLPFAQDRFCKSEEVEKVITLSQLRNRDFGRDYGIAMKSGPLAGLLARAVVIVDENDTVTYTQLVPEIGQEPDYDDVLTHVS